MSTFYGVASGTTRVIGNQPALPVITITPAIAGDYGFRYRRFVSITNNSPNALNNYPYNIADTVLDTAALILDGDMLATGDDLRVYIDGVEVKRWFGGGGIDSTTTKIWVNWTQPAKSDMTLGDVIAGTGDVATITIENTAANIALLPNIPANGNVLIGSEIFVYTGVNVGLRQLTGCARAERETSAAAHSASDVVKFVTHDVWIYYGNPTVAPYVVDDTKKPVIDLVNSTNNSHIYTEFGSNDGLRTGSWVNTKGFRVNALGNIIISGGPATMYTGYERGLNTNPWEVIGIAGPSFWQLYNPCGISHIKMEGRKWQQSYVGWDPQVHISMDGTTFAFLWSESAPSLFATWQYLDVHDQDIVSPFALYPFYFRFGNFGGVLVGNGVTQGHNYEAGDITVGVAYPPTISVSAEDDFSFTLNTTMTNSAGYSMQIELPVKPGSYVIVDTKEKTVRYSDGSNQINAIVDMPVRTEWFPLVPGVDNDISITESGNVAFGFAWEDRAM
jgi:hypothetical protein